MHPLTIGTPSPDDVIGRRTPPLLVEPLGTRTLSNGTVILRDTVPHRS